MIFPRRHDDEWNEFSERGEKGATPTVDGSLRIWADVISQAIYIPDTWGGGALFKGAGQVQILGYLGRQIAASSKVGVELHLSSLGLVYEVAAFGRSLSGLTGNKLLISRCIEPSSFR